MVRPVRSLNPGETIGVIAYMGWPSRAKTKLSKGTLQKGTEEAN